MVKMSKNMCTFAKSNLNKAGHSKVLPCSEIKEIKLQSPPKEERTHI